MTLAHVSPLARLFTITLVSGGKVVLRKGHTAFHSVSPRVVISDTFPVLSRFSSSTRGAPGERKHDSREKELPPESSSSSTVPSSLPSSSFLTEEDSNSVEFHSHPSPSTSSVSSFGEELSPLSRQHWRLMESTSAEKNSHAIPVLSTIAKGEDEASSTSAKPLSLWPGMYHSPVTAALWSARSSILERAAYASSDGPPQVTLLTRSPSHSRTSILYSFYDDEILREQYRNPWSGVRMGKLLEDLDALAGTIAVKHCADDDQTTRPLLLVTASVDKIKVLKPLLLSEDLKIAGAVAWVGRSSMEIRMEVIQPVGTENQQLADGEDDEDSLALVANFTFVARDSNTRKAAQVNRLRPESDVEKKLYQEGEARDAKRKSGLKNAGELIKAGKAGQHDARLQALLSEGRVLRELPTLADRNSILISDTRLENAMICQPQQRNMHGRIFGGFLMRRAYELAYSTCYVFCGTKPEFLEVDHVDFRRPVDVGDLLRFNSCVLYTETKQLDVLMHIEVVAYVTQPELRSSEVSNTFYFTFTLDESLSSDGAPPIFKVVPGSEEEARTVLARYDADDSVKHPLLEKQNSAKGAR